MTNEDAQEIINLLKYTSDLAYTASQKVAAIEALLKVQPDLWKVYQTILDAQKSGDDGAQVAIKIEALETKIGQK